MTLARHEPCQLLDGILAQILSCCWTLTIRLPYAQDNAAKCRLAITGEVWYNTHRKERQ
jgi:hypothetical protein